MHCSRTSREYNCDDERGDPHDDGRRKTSTRWSLAPAFEPAFWERARNELPVPLVDPGVACWKWAELAADLYLRLGISHSKAYGYEAPPVVRPLR